MRYGVVTPREGVDGSPYVIIEGDSGIIGVICPDKKLSKFIEDGLALRGLTTIEKATSKMSYYDVSTNILDDDNKRLLNMLARKWKSTLPPEIAEPDEPKESVKNE